MHAPITHSTSRASRGGSPGVVAVEQPRRGASLRRKKYSVARRQSVGKPRTERWSEPSGFSSRGATSAASGPGVREPHELGDRVARPPGIGVEQQEVPAARTRMPAFQPAPSPRFSCLTTRASGNRSRTSSSVPSSSRGRRRPSRARARSRGTARATAARPASRRPPRRRRSSALVRAHFPAAPRPAANPSQARITPPGTERASVTRKKRKPVAKAASWSTPSWPRNETKNDSRTASPLIVNGTRMTRNSSGPHHVVRARREVDADRLPGQPDRQDADACTTTVNARTPTSSPTCAR